MKKIYLLIIAMCFGFITKAQNNDSSSFYKNEIGFDGMHLIKNMVNFGDNSYYTSRYPFTYKRFFSKKTALRIGFNFNYQISDFFSTNNVPNESKYFSSDIQMGLEFRKDFSKKWTFYYGVDLIFEYSNYYSNRPNSYGSNKYYRKSLSFGLGPVAGIEFHINKRLSLSTEGNLYGTYATSETKYEYNYPSSIDKDIYENLYINKVLPRTVSIKYKF